MVADGKGTLVPSRARPEVVNPDAPAHRTFLRVARRCWTGPGEGASLPSRSGICSSCMRCGCHDSTTLLHPPLHFAPITRLAQPHPVAGPRHRREPAERAPPDRCRDPFHRRQVDRAGQRGDLRLLPPDRRTVTPPAEPAPLGHPVEPLLPVVGRLRAADGARLPFRSIGRHERVRIDRRSFSSFSRCIDC